jgi:hypothetical protein
MSRRRLRIASDRGKRCCCLAQRQRFAFEQGKASTAMLFTGKTGWLQDGTVMGRMVREENRAHNLGAAMTLLRLGAAAIFRSWQS